MDLLSAAQTYFDAWNQRDPAAIVRTFVEGGTYTDPASGGTLVGEAIGRYAADLFAAFPSLSFEIVSAGPVAENLVAAQWIMRGTNAGPLLGAPPTGRDVELPGADFVTVERDKIRSVRGYFDQKDFAEQLGLQAIVQPYSIGPLSLGTCAYLNTGTSRTPGAFSLTWIEVRSDAEGVEVDERSQKILEELAQTPGFISTVLTNVGRRGH